MIGELLAAVLVVIVGSALASGTEAALFSVSVIKVRQLADQGIPAARVLLQIRENMSRPIATIVILNNIFNIVGSIVVGGIAATALGSEWLGLFSALLTLAVIIGSEIIPKNLGERYAEPISLATARPVLLLTKLMFPLVWMIEHVVSPITKGKPRLVTNEAEIQLLAQIGQQEGSIELDEAQLIQRVFRLNDSTAGSIMTPRVSMTYVHGEETLAEIRDQVIASPHSRILVIGESIDEVQGVALKSELLVALVNGQTDRLLSDLAREVLFVPEMVRADQLLATFRDKREHLAVVVDEFGGVAGVVTLEDVLEVLTGEIVDETDLVVDLQEWARQRRKVLLDRQEQQEPSEPEPSC
jgi:CBS domain containing-hemolysin-like protein